VTGKLRLRTAKASLVLSDPAATRSLVAIIAILTFLAGLAAAGAEIVAAGSREWRASISREATIQLRPQAGRDIEADLARVAALGRSTEGVVEARIVSKTEAEALLEPWLGRGLDLSSLPVPRLVVLRLGIDAAPDLKGLARRIAADISGASLDDHSAWRARLSGLANTVIGIAAGLVVLVIVASGIAIGFATRGAMAGSRDVVDVLQLVGADRRFIVREFAQRFLWLAAAAALCGAAGAALTAPLLGNVASLASATGSGASDAFLGSASIGWRGYLLIGVVAATVAAIAGLVSVATAKRFLRQLRAT
jgi:cell division transport system permease protein